MGDPGRRGAQGLHAQLYRVDEVLAIYPRINSAGADGGGQDDSMAQWWKGKFTLAEHHERLKAVPNLRSCTSRTAGHMLHHDQPQQLAALIEGFLDSLRRRARQISVAAKSCGGRLRLVGNLFQPLAEFDP